jgi:predicted O-methyltransferase YrrM
MPILSQVRSFAGHLYHRLADQAVLWGLVDPQRKVKKDLAGLAETNPQIATAIIDAVGNKTSPEERSWVERIEELRRQMNASSEELEMMDYGAGSSKSQLTQEEMYKGRVVHRTLGQICSVASKSDRTELLLFRLMREIKPGNCIELGTSVGVSACYQSAALKLNGSGKLVTMEGADSVASVAVRNFATLGLDNVELVRGRFQDTLADVLRANPLVDYAFIDGHHDGPATVRYFNEIAPALAPAAVLMFDDIRWSEGMTQAWDEIRKDPRVRVSVDLGCMGLIWTGEGSSAVHFNTKF